MFIFVNNLCKYVNLSPMDSRLRGNDGAEREAGMTSNKRWYNIISFSALRCFMDSRLRGNDEAKPSQPAPACAGVTATSDITTF